MKNHNLFSRIAIILAATMALVSCGAGGTGTIPTSLTGVAFKGPMDAATILIEDEQGTILATTSTTAGKFTLAAFNIPAATQALFVRTQGGSYTDEATGTTVAPATNIGLMTVLTAASLQTAIATGQVIVLTPETTLMARLVQFKLTQGIAADVAITQANQLIQTALIDGTSPIAAVPGDTLLLNGDLSTAIPANQIEALARNRAISFSYETRNFNLAPAQVFDLITLRAADLQDGLLDGKQNQTLLTLTDRNGAIIALNTVNQKTHFALARTQLLNNTVKRLSQGKLSQAEIAGLSALGMNTGLMNQQNTNNQAALQQTQTLLAATNLPAFQPLPVLLDQDGNPNNAAATYTLTATPNVNVTINAPGTSWLTPMMRYNGLQLPPVIKANRGDVMTLNLVNNLTADTTIHWHGFKIPAIQDGGPDFPVLPGSSKVYSFPMLQPAAPLWFHPHPDMKTGQQVYNGLAGLFLLNDSISQQLETGLQLPSGRFDVPLLIQDRRFNALSNGVRSLAYKTQMMDGIAGMLGNDVLVNGTVLPQMNVETRQYRFRLFNTSNARTYDFALSDGGTFSVVGSDGGLLPQPVSLKHILLAPAERVEIIVDFARYAVGSKVMLISQPFSGNMMSMMNGGGMNGGGMNGGGMNGGGMNGGGMNGGGMNGATANGAYMDIMRFDIATAAVDNITLYTALPATADINTQRLNAASASRTRNFVMSMAMGGNGGGASFLINGAPFNMNVDNEVITLAQGNTEIWSIQNRSPMAHPFHAHAIQWQVLDRNGVPASGVDLGWKDTVLVQPGETVRFIGRFDPLVNIGRYMYHCHILEHEDAGMMGFFRIQ